MKWKEGQEKRERRETENREKRRDRKSKRGEGIEEEEKGEQTARTVKQREVSKEVTNGGPEKSRRARENKETVTRGYCTNVKE